MAYTISPNRVEIKQLTDNRRKYAVAIFDNKVSDVFSFIEIFVKPEHINGKNIIDNSLKIKMDINSFAETLKFLKEESCISLSKNSSKHMVEYFENSKNPKRYDLCKEHRNLLFFDISVNKRNFKKLIKRDFCTKKHCFEINKDKNNISLLKISIFIAVIGVIVMVLFGLFGK